MTACAWTRTQLPRNPPRQHTKWQQQTHAERFPCVEKTRCQRVHSPVGRNQHRLKRCWLRSKRLDRRHCWIRHTQATPPQPDTEYHSNERGVLRTQSAPTHRGEAMIGGHGFRRLLQDAAAHGHPSERGSVLPRLLSNSACGTRWKFT